MLGATNRQRASDIAFSICSSLVLMLVIFFSLFESPATVGKIGPSPYGEELQPLYEKQTLTAEEFARYEELMQKHQEWFAIEQERALSGSGVEFVETAWKANAVELMPINLIVWTALFLAYQWLAQCRASVLVLLVPIALTAVAEAGTLWALAFVFAFMFGRLLRQLVARNNEA